MKTRLREIEHDPDERWRLTGAEKHELKEYPRRRGDWEHMLRTTSIAAAPWYVIDGADRRYRELTVATLLLAAMREACARKVMRPAAQGVPPAPAVLGNVEIVRRLDLTQRLPKKRYETELTRFQARLARLTRHKRFAERALVLAFEGVDAAGKGGAIRRVTAALDPRVYRVIPVAAPNDEERSRHYLWRFWRRLSRAGRVMIFDRSWYGRVLVERVEQFATEAEWSRAYAEINEFEEQLTDHGIVIVKYWLHITSDEQERRFKERASTPVKSWKLSDEDWRNRAKWGQYELAVNDMVARTSTRNAPWHLVEANDKNYARIKVLRIANAALKKALA